ncbi:MAG: hypothetical protein HC836_15645 [Richelia sp. RM2_1_2]|nr:hypothetical protein [Richelia sp. RM2_1_2]
MSIIRGSEFHPILRNIFGEVRNYGNEQMQVCCPKCQENDGLTEPDGKFNLEINTANRHFHCWKCDPKFSGRIGRLIKRYGTPSDYEQYKAYAGTDYVSYNPKEDEKVYEPVVMPAEMILFANMDYTNPKHMEALIYMTGNDFKLKQRNLSKEVLVKFKVGFCLDGKYYNRIIIPSYDSNGELNYFVARTFKEGVKPSYMNPEVNKDLFIFNEGFINWDSTVYIVEGTFEMLSFPVNTVPLLGKTINSTLYKLLNKKKPNVVVVLDPDAFRENLKIFHSIKALYGGQPDKVKFVTLPGKHDLDEIRRFKGEGEVVKQLRTAKDEPTDEDLIRASCILGNNEKKWNWLNK